MFNIIGSLILIVSLAVLIFIFLKKQNRLLKVLEEESKLYAFEEKERKSIEEKIEDLDKEINKILEFFLRKIKTLFLKGDNLISRWLLSLRKNGSLSEEKNLFLGERISEKEEENSFEKNKNISKSSKSSGKGRKRKVKTKRVGDAKEKLEEDVELILQEFEIEEIDWEEEEK